MTFTITMIVIIDIAFIFPAISFSIFYCYHDYDDCFNTTHQRQQQH